jgi:hypothetical protein
VSKNDLKKYRTELKQIQIKFQTFVACLTGYIFAMFSGRSIRDDGFLTDQCQKNTSDTDPANEEVVDSLKKYIMSSILNISFSSYLFRSILQLCNKYSSLLGCFVSANKIR